MSNTINADNGVVSTVPGLKYSADTSGELILQTNTTNALTLDTTQGASFATGVLVNNPYAGSYSSGMLLDHTTSLGRISVGPSSAIAFYTNAIASRVETMRITSTGAISFGATGTAYGTSGQVLTSAGNAPPTWTTPATTSPGGSNTQVQFNNSGAFGGSANMTFNGTTLTVNDLTDSSLTIGRVVFPTTGGNLTGSANFFWDNTNLRLGIGTTSPTSPLTVGNNNRIAALNTSGSDVSLAIVNGSNDVFFGDDSVNTNTATWRSRGASIFQVNTTERMRITSTGAVGIGNSNPGALLHVTNNSNTYAGGILIGSAGVASGYISTTDNLYIKPNTSANTASGAVYIANFSGTPQIGLDSSTGRILNAGNRPMVNQTGGVLQVLSATDTAQYVFNAGSANQFTYYDIGGLTLTITPSSTSSKILIFADVCSGQYANGYNAFFRINRNGSAVGVGVNGSYGGSSSNGMRTVDGSEIGSVSFQYLDSPATTSAVTYKIQICNSGGGSYPSTVNRPYNSSTGWEQSGQSTFTIMEIAG